MAERFRSYMGPGDKDLPRANEVQGYQPVSRIGEVVMNAFGALPRPARDTVALCAPLSPRIFPPYSRCLRAPGAAEAEQSGRSAAGVPRVGDDPAGHDRARAQEADRAVPAVPRCGDRHARHRVRRVLGPGRRAQLLLRGRVCVPVPCSPHMPCSCFNMALFSPHTPPATGRSKTVRTPDDGIGPSVDECTPRHS